MTKPIKTAHVNVGVIGNTGEGPVRLAIALANCCTQIGNRQSLEETLEKSVDSYTFLEYESDTRHYAHIVFPRQDRLTNTYQHLPSLDGCVLYLGQDGITKTTRAQLLMTAAAGVSQAIVFVEGSSTLPNETKRDLTTLLREAGFDSARVPIISGSTQQDPKTASDDTKAFEKLLSLMDRDFEPRQGHETAPFLMPIDDVFSIVGRGVVVTGRIERGVIHKNEALDLVGQSRITATRCVDIETFRQNLDSAHEGDHVGVLIDHADKSTVARGMLLAKSGSLRLLDHFEAEVYLENATSQPRQVEFLFRTIIVPGEMSTDVQTITAKTWSAITARIEEPYGLEIGMKFVISLDGEFAGIGKVTNLP